MFSLLRSEERFPLSQVMISCNRTHSVVASYKPSMLVTGARFPVCAFPCLCVLNVMHDCLDRCVWGIGKSTSRRTNMRTEFVVWVWSTTWASSRTWPRHRGPCGLMDKALVFGTKDCRFESCQGHFLRVRATDLGLASPVLIGNASAIGG